MHGKFADRYLHNRVGHEKIRKDTIKIHRRRLQTQAAL
jgi:hypothetical protein